MTQPDQLTVVSYNIHRGVGALGKANILANIRRMITTYACDVVCLQEVWADPDRLEGALEHLADDTWPERVYGRNAIFPDGHLGNAMLSRFKLKNWCNLDLSCGHFEKRGCLVAEIFLPNGRAAGWIFCVHMGLREKERMAQLQVIRDFIRTQVPADAPVILAGDFNDWRNRMAPVLEGELGFTEAFRNRSGRYAKTFPWPIPLLALDRIYVRHWKIEQVERLKLPRFASASDHLPVAARLVMVGRVFENRPVQAT